MSVNKTSAEPWRAHYAHACDWALELPQLNLPDMFAAAVAAHGDKPLVDFLGRQFSYAALHAEACAVGGFVAEALPLRIHHDALRPWCWWIDEAPSRNLVQTIGCAANRLAQYPATTNLSLAVILRFSIASNAGSQRGSNSERNCPSTFGS